MLGKFARTKNARNVASTHANPLSGIADLRQLHDGCRSGLSDQSPDRCTGRGSFHFSFQIQFFARDKTVGAFAVIRIQILVLSIKKNPASSAG